MHRLPQSCLGGPAYSMARPLPLATGSNTYFSSDTLMSSSSGNPILSFEQSSSLFERPAARILAYSSSEKHSHGLSGM